MATENNIPPPEKLDDTYTKTVRMQATGADGKTIRISIPRVVVQKEAKKHNLSLDRFLELYRAEWRFNSFEGAYMLFVPIEKNQGADHG